MTPELYGFLQQDAKSAAVWVMTDDELINIVAMVLVSAKAATLTDEEVSLFWDVRAELELRNAKSRSAGGGPLEPIH
jgi:hypothetical protein